MTSPDPDRAARRADGSMSLLVDMMTNTLDDGYRVAAERRTRPEPHLRAAPGPSRRAVWLPLLVLLGLLTGTAAAQVRDRARAGDTTRADLAGAVAERTTETDALEERLAALRAELAEERDRALGADEAGRRSAARLAELEVAAGTVPVEGPGLVVVLDDAPAPDPAEPVARGEGVPGSGRVLDRDLQDAVNGLWAAGAEAVAVDGLRLTALTAVRSAGDLVLVDFRPVTPPYVVEAVGDPEALEEGLAASGTRQRLEDLSVRYGIGLQVRRADELRLPAAGAPDLRSVRLP